MIELLAKLLLDYHTLNTHLDPALHRDRIYQIAKSNVEVCQENPIRGVSLQQCIALVSTADKWESGLTEAIHNGKPGPSGELCLAQLHRSVIQVPHPKYAISLDEWKSIIGLENTKNCARLALRVISWHIFRCHIRLDRYGVAYLFSQYHLPRPSTSGDINSCPGIISTMSFRRADSYMLLLGKIREGV